jgi:CheY-like chemotaxis protein
MNILALDHNCIRPLLSSAFATLGQSIRKALQVEDSLSPRQRSNGVLPDHGNEEPYRQIGTEDEPALAALSGRKTILYIEDNQANALLMQRVLTFRPSVRLLATGLGRKGLLLAQEHEPDLILLDVNLPDMHGDQVLSCLHHHPRTSKIPVVMISADAIGGEIDRLMELGASTYLTKPFEVQYLLAVLDDLLAGATPSAIAQA